MRPLFILILTAFQCLTAIAQTDDQVLFTIDGEPVFLEEFEYIYQKNNFNNKADYSEESLREYLDLYINFRLKVKEAEARGLDKDVKLLSELSVYQEQLYNSFFDRENLTELISEAERRLQTDISICHIYVDTRRNVESKEASRALIDEAYDKLQSGMDFSQAAALYSQDAYTKNNSGLLGYYTALQIAFYEMEDAAYNTKAGTYSKPIETPLGFHIIKVNDRRPARGQIKVAVIKMNKRDQKYNEELKNRIQAVYEEIITSGDFGQAVLKYSEDRATKGKGGEMEWFGISQYDRTFEDAVFALEEQGQVSKPFETSKAWYIAKLIDRKAAVESDEDRDVLATKVKQSDRYKKRKEAHINAILDEFGYAEIEPAFSQFKTSVIESFENNSVLQLSELEPEQTVLSIAGVDHSDRDFAGMINQNSYKYRKLSSTEKFDQLMEDFTHDKAIEFHIIQYGKENREYGALLNEYRDGILLFELMEQNVWSKAVSDTVGLRAFYEANKSSFKTEEELLAKAYTVADAKQASLLLKALKADPNLSNIKWLSKLSKKGIQTDYESLYIRRSDDLASQVSWKRGLYTINSDDGIRVIEIEEVIPPKTRSFEDSKGFVIAQYQEHLEKEWMNSLRDQYTIVVNEPVLQSIMK